jgi:hypothetical protein
MKILATSLTILAFASAASGQSFTLTTLTGASQISISAGEEFSLKLTLDVPYQSTGVSVYLETTSGVGLFSITGRDTSLTPYVDLTTNSLSGGNALLNPRTADLGGTLINPTSPINAGTFQISTFTIRANATLSPGTYTLSTSDILSTVQRTQAEGFSSGPVPPTTFTVNIVPEPGSVSLLLCGLLGLIGLRRHRMSAISGEGPYSL